VFTSELYSKSIPKQIYTAKTVLNTSGFTRSRKGINNIYLLYLHLVLNLIPNVIILTPVLLAQGGKCRFRFSPLCPAEIVDVFMVDYGYKIKLDGL